MLKIIPPFRNPKNTYQGTPLPKFKDAVKKIFKYSKMSILETKKHLAERQIFTDTENIAKRLNSDKIRPRDLKEIFRHSSKQKTLKPWQVEYISGYLTKGGTILSSKITTAPETQEPNKSQNTPNFKKTFNKDEVRKFHEDLEKRIAERRNFVKLSEPKAKEETDKIKTARFETFSKDISKSKPVISKRGSESADKSPVSNMQVKGFKPRGVSYRIPYKEPPLNSKISDYALSEFKGSDLGEKLNSKISDKKFKSNNLSEENDWRYKAYDSDLVNLDKQGDSTGLQESTEAQRSQIDK